MNHKSRLLVLSLCFCAFAAVIMAYAPVGVIAAAPSANPLDDAFGGLLDLEAVINARDKNGEYVSQNEGSESFANRLSPHVTSTYVGVNGLGHVTAAFGYQPTAHGAQEYADAIILFRSLLVQADIADGGNGTADWIHTPYSGAVSGNVAYFVLNFEVRGTDGAAVELDLGELGVVPVHGRCICTCVRDRTGWRIDAFYFVLTPADMLYDV